LGAIAAVLSLDEAGDLVFTTGPTLGLKAVYRVADGRLMRVLAAGDTVPGGTLLGIREAAANARGDVVVYGAFQETPSSSRLGLFLVPAAGPPHRILADGDPSPAGGRFYLDYPLTRPTVQMPWRTSPKINRNGDVLFVAPLTSAGSEGGLFVWQGGRLRRLLLSGDPVPGSAAAKFDIVGFASPGVGQPAAPGTSAVFDWSDARVAAVTAFTPGFRGGIGLFLVSEQSVLLLAADGDKAPGIEDEVFGRAPSVFRGRQFSPRLSELGDVTFPASVCCGKFTQGIFQARLPEPAVPNGGFEGTTAGPLPAGWTTSWSNDGLGDAASYSAADDVAEGAWALRLHVVAGSAFVLSDPVPATPDTPYLVSARLRFNLDARDAAYFAVLSYDASGRELGLDEIRLGPGDGSWTWQPIALPFRTRGGTVSIRIRIGLAAEREQYLDVDDVR
jgi:hypothetical protein